MLELIAVPIIAILWRIGGKGGWPGARYVRRLGVPLIVSVLALLSGISWYWCLAYIAAFYGVTTLPNTLIGSSIWNAPWWLPIKGFLYGLTLLALDPSRWLFALITAAVFDVLFSYTWFTSNTGQTKTKDAHAHLELMLGAAYGLLAWFFLT